MRAALILVASVVMIHSASADFRQQGSVLLGGLNTLPGYAVAVSADGNTLIASDPTDSNGIGAAYVFIRSNGAWVQQGSKLVGTGNVGSSQQGYSVALSADGNTAALGALYDNSSVGATWIFTRSGGVWSQQGSKLVASDYSLVSRQGSSVALSADGSTLLVGGPQDNFGIGAVWAFTRSNGVWAQQGSKLIGTGAYNGRDGSSQGISVALSADGNTAVVGAPFDGRTNVARYGGAGAVWVFTRSAGVWTQQGSKLLASDVTDTGQYYYPEQGRSVAVSADGNTLMFGAPYDNYSAGGPGAAWIFTRSNGVWSQQGSKLTGSGYVLSSGCAEANCVLQGWSVALSGDGTTAFVGGRTDGTNSAVTGAVWTFARCNGSNWTQRGLKLVGTGANGNAQEGYSVALSNAGTTGVIGSVGQGAWVFIQPVPAHDFNHDCKSDIVWRNSNGDNAMWLMNGSSIGTVAGLVNVTTNWTPVGQRDFDGDGKSDILWRDTSGNVAMWLMNGSSIASVASLGNIPTNWAVVGTADFNGDGKGDILWRNSAGDNAIWFMNGSSILSIAGLSNVPTNWSIAGTADFNGDGTGDILWRNLAGDNAIWLMNGATISSVAGLGNVPTNWSIVGTADFDGDGKGDILWRNGAGDNAIWLMNGTTIASVAGLGNIPTNWSIVSAGDYNGDSKGDILWRNSAGDNAIWFMNGTTLSSIAGLGNVPTNWTIQKAAAN